MRPDLNILIEKYWEGETSIEEEHDLKAYFRAGDVSDEHLPFVESIVICFNIMMNKKMWFSMKIIR